MCVSIYMYMSHILRYICICIYVYVYICLHIYLYAYVCKYINMYIIVCIVMHSNIHIYLCICDIHMYVDIYMCAL